MQSGICLEVQIQTTDNRWTQRRS